MDTDYGKRDKLHISDFIWLINRLNVDGYLTNTQLGSWNMNGCALESEHIQIFNGETELNISRRDCFNTAIGGDYKEFILKVLYWGYPRGNKYATPIIFLKENSQIEEFLNYLSAFKHDNELTEFKFDEQFKGLKLSTLSKFWFFLELKCSGCEALILDRKMIEVITDGPFADFDNLRRHTQRRSSFQFYCEYLKTMRKIADKYKIQPSRLEFFLFNYGDILSRTIA